MADGEIFHPSTMTPPANPENKVKEPRAFIEFFAGEEIRNTPDLRVLAGIIRPLLDQLISRVEEEIEENRLPTMESLEEGVKLLVSQVKEAELTRGGLRVTSVPQTTRGAPTSFYAALLEPDRELVGEILDSAATAPRTGGRNIRGLGVPFGNLCKT